VNLAERLHAEMQTATRQRDELRRDTLRMAIAAAYNAEKQARRPLTEDELIGVLAREVKTRRESVDAFRAAGRTELAEKEEREVGILTDFLPQQLSEADLRLMVTAAIDESGASSAREMGRVMGLLAPRTRGRADGKLVSSLVAQELAKRDLAGHGHA
jgi:uncharacterized protein YqeY